MYLVMMCQWNRVMHVKAFKNHPDAANYADQLAVGVRCESILNGFRSGPIQPTFIPLVAGKNWEDNDYRQVYENDRGMAVMIEPCGEPNE